MTASFCHFVSFSSKNEILRSLVISQWKAGGLTY